MTDIELRIRIAQSLADVPAAGLDHALPRARLEERRVALGGALAGGGTAEHQYQDETAHPSRIGRRGVPS